MLETKIVWHRCEDELPKIPKGERKQFLIAYSSEGNLNKNLVIAIANFFNEFPLFIEAGCDICSQPGEEMHEDGCPCSGWYLDKVHYEYDDFWSPLDPYKNNVILWAEVPEILGEQNGNC